MNQVATLRSGALTGPQLSLIRRTVAKDCNNDEFDHFMAVARELQLDPLRKQICALVFSKNDDTKRNMAIIVQIDGLRAIANRCGDYRAADKAPLIEYDAALKGPDNPLGIVRCEVTLWRFAHGAWHAQVGEAHWDEFAPVTDIAEGGYRWVETGEFYQDSGKPKKRKEPVGDIVRGIDPKSNWAKMGRIMIAKCAEAQALRKGWPEQFAGVYAEEEMHRAEVIDVAASEVLADHEEAERLRRVGAGDSLIFVFDPMIGVESVARGAIADRLTRFYEREAPSAQAILDFRQRNEASLKTFWAWAQSDALDVKRIQERRLAELIAQKADPAGDTAAASPSPGAAAAPSFDDLKDEGLACLQSKTKRRALATWALKLTDEALAHLSADERGELRHIEQNIREEIGA